MKNPLKIIGSILRALKRLRSDDLQKRINDLTEEKESLTGQLQSLEGQYKDLTDRMTMEEDKTIPMGDTFAEQWKRLSHLDPTKKPH